MGSHDCSSGQLDRWRQRFQTNAHRPRSAQFRLAGFRESDRLTTLELPENDSLPAIAKSIETAMKAEQTANVRRACADFVTIASEFYEVPACTVRVLAARPLKVREQWTMELFGDYAPETMVMPVWMRTAVRKEITSFVLVRPTPFFRSV